MQFLDGIFYKHFVVTTMSPKRSPRPKIQRSFVRWFKENRHRFNVQIQITEISGKRVELRFPQYPDVLSVWLLRWDLNVSVDWQGKNWDMLISLAAVPVATASGYRCALCENTCTTWPTRDALWQDELFEPFLKWVNERLAPATWLRLYGTKGGTWAKLGNHENAPFGAGSHVMEFTLKPN